MLRRLFMMLPLFLSCAFISPALAQISPGPLSSAHASLEGNRNCTQCHGLKQESIQEHCLKCHAGVAFLLEQGRGFHAHLGSVECEKCHPEHAGTDFTLIEWPEGSADKFKHESTGWALAGAHARAKCGACHRPKFQTGPAAVKEPAGSIHEGKSWLGLETDCTHCHKDPHEGSLGKDCAHCHGQEAWRPVSNFDHARTTYPLDGRHAQLKCAQCHQNQQLGAKTDSSGKVVPLYRPLPHQDCQPCHSDPHQGRFQGKCSGCHTTAGFKLASTSGFNHTLTSFPLRGEHAKLRCEKCHDPQSAWGKRPAHDRCDRCHRNPHAEQVLSVKGVRSDCATCHDETSWKKSNFDLTRHAKTAFALTGAHAKLSCGKCHRAAEGVTPDPAWGPAHVRLRMESKRCLDCHAPAHGKEIDPSRDCTECHGVDAWRPSRVDAKAHAALGWPLEGRHGEIQCGSCHLPRGSKTVSTGLDADLAGTKWLFASLGRPCAECHLDPHEGRYAKSADWSAKNPCRRCHSMRTFSPSTIGVEDHAAFGFKLEGAHRTVPCFACHRELAQAPATSSLVASKASPRKLAFKDKRRACRDCHTSATLPSSGVRQ
ncbi:MAG TPA: cytochrome c3 family protein [Candidatus Krumholzibacteria bacterium]|nr:cytochrome c3 family protein [Candidatus Krumholzibacteria bacterium]